MQSLTVVINGVNVVLTPLLVLSNAAVQDGLVAGNNSSWNSSKTSGLEHGGWIYVNLTTQVFKVKKKTGNLEPTAIGLTPPPAADAGYKLIADWHCHPRNVVRQCRPSEEDINNHATKPYFSFVITYQKQPISGWPATVVPHIEVIVSGADYHVWNINP